MDSVKNDEMHQIMLEEETTLRFIIKKKSEDNKRFKVSSDSLKWQDKIYS
jgi:hypothetical protein